LNRNPEGDYYLGMMTCSDGYRENPFPYEQECFKSKVEAVSTLRLANVEKAYCVIIYGQTNEYAILTGGG